MKRTRQNPGFTLLEMSTVLAIIGVLAALSYAALEVLPQRTRLTGSALEFSAVLSSARSHAYGRNQRVVVLINASTVNGTDPVQYWAVADNWFNMEKTLAANPDWNTLSDLVPVAPAPAGSQYLVFDSGRFNASVRLVQNGFKNAVGSVAAKGCGTTLTDKISMAEGPTTGSDSFPPPFCFVPADRACTFCTGEGDDKPVRGAVFFEPDGTVSFTDASGVAVADGSASITLTPVKGELSTAQAVVMTNTGLVRTFPASR